MDLWLSSLQSNATHLLISEIHDLFLESGFIGYNYVTGTPIDRFPDSPNSGGRTSTLSISYTLPTLLANNAQIQNPPSVLIKFQTLANYLVVCGSVARDGSYLHRRRLNKSKAFAAVINYGNVSEFRRRMKDGLCFPLLIDISEAAGLPGPNCFSTLPNELKLGIMALLPATAVARMECVCKILRGLSASGNYQLWESKFSKEFGEVQAAEARRSLSMGRTWKQRFIGKTKEKKEKRKRDWNAILARQQLELRLGELRQGLLRQDQQRLAGLVEMMNPAPI